MTKEKRLGCTIEPCSLPMLKVDFKPANHDVIIHDSQQAFKYLQRYWEGSIFIQEKVYALFLNNGRSLHGCNNIATGSYKSCDFDESLLYGLALTSRSTKIIIAHNHTSGKINPSDRDKSTTQRIKDGCELLGIKLVDHLIIGENSFFSFADHDVIL